MKQKKTNRVALLLHWAGEQKVWLFLAVLLAMAGGLCIVVPYIEIYRLMDAAFGGTCTKELWCGSWLLWPRRWCSALCCSGRLEWYPTREPTARCSRCAVW